MAESPSAGSPSRRGGIRVSANEVIKPDGGLEAAVAAVKKNAANRRMLLFALRSLAECCGPAQNKNAPQNALGLVEREALPVVLQTALSTDADGECKSLCTQVLYGLTLGLQRYPAAVTQSGELFITHLSQDSSLPGAVSCLAEAVVRSRSTDLVCIEALVGCVSILLDLQGFSLERYVIAQHLTDWLNSATANMKATLSQSSVRLRKESESKAALVATTLALVARLLTSASKENLPVFPLASITRLCTAISQLPRWFPDPQNSALAATKAVKPMVAANAKPEARNKAEALTKAAEAMAAAAAHAGGPTAAEIKEEMSAMMALVLASDRMDTCLKSLQKIAFELDNETLEALNLLSILAMSTAFKQKLNKMGSKAIHFLLTLLGNIVASIKQTEDAAIPEAARKGLTGALRLLGYFAEAEASKKMFSAHAMEEFIQHSASILSHYGSLEKSTAAVEVVGAVVATLHNILLSPAASRRTVADMIVVNTGTLLVNSNTTSNSVVAPHTVGLLHDLLLLDSGRKTQLVTVTEQLPLVKRLVASAASSPDDSTLQLKCLQVAEVIVPLLTSSKASSDGGLVGLCVSTLNRSHAGTELVRTTLRVLQSLLRLPNASEDPAIVGGSLFDALVIILEDLMHSDSQEATAEADREAIISLLNQIARSTDLDRCIAGLSGTFSALKCNEMSLAAQGIAAAAEIDALRKDLKVESALTSLTALLKKIVAYRSHMPERQALIRTFMNTVLALTKAAEASHEIQTKLLKDLLEVAVMPNFALFVDRELKGATLAEQGNNSLSAVLQTAATVCQLRYSGQNVECHEFVPVIQKLLRANASHPMVLVSVLQLANAFAQQDPRAADCLVTTGGLKAIIELMQRTTDSVEVVAVGIEVSAALLCLLPGQKPLEAKEEALRIDAVKKAGLVPVLTTVARRWPDGVIRKDLLSRIRQKLVTEGAVDSEAESALLRLAAAVKCKDMVEATDAIMCAADALAGRDASTLKAFERMNGYKEFGTAIAELLAGTPSPIHGEFAVAAVRALNVAVEVGDASAVCRYIGATQSSSLVSALAVAPVEKKLTCLREFLKLLEVLCKIDASFADAALRKNVFEKTCAAISDLFAQQSVQGPTTTPGTTTMTGLTLISPFFAVLHYCKADEVLKSKAVGNLLQHLLGFIENKKSSTVLDDKARAVTAVSSFAEMPARRRTVAADGLLEKLALDLKMVEIMHAAVLEHEKGQLPADKTIVERAQRCIAALGTLRNLRNHCSEITGIDVDKYAKTVRMSRADADAARIGMALTTAGKAAVRLGDAGGFLPSDQGTSYGVNTFEGIQRTTTKQIKLDAVGGSSATLPEDENLHSVMEKLIELHRQNKTQITVPQAAPPAWVVEFGSLADNLSLFIGPDVSFSNEAHAFELTSPCLQAIGDVVTRLFARKLPPAKQHAPLLLSTARICKLLSTRFPNDPPYGANAVADNGVSTLFELIINSDRAMRSRPHVIDSFTAATACLLPVESDRRASVLKLVSSDEFKTVPLQAFDLLCTPRYAADADVISVVLGFLAAIAVHPPGGVILRESVIPEQDIKGFVKKLESIVERHGECRGTVSAAAVDMVSGMARSYKGIVPPELEADALRKITRTAEKSPEGLAALIRHKARELKSYADTSERGSIEVQTTAVASQKAVDGYLRSLELLKQSSACSASHNTDIVMSLAQFVEAQVQAQMVAVGASPIFDCMVSQLEASFGDYEQTTPKMVSAVAVSCRAIRDAAAQDTAAEVAFRKAVRRLICGEVGSIAHLDADAAIELLEAAQAAFIVNDKDALSAGTQEQSKLFSSLREMLGNIELSLGKYAPEKASFLRSLIDSLRARLGKIQVDDSKQMTLVDIYDLWYEHESDLVTDVECPQVLRHIDFVFEKTDEYGRTDHADPETPLAREFLAGLRCLQLLTHSTHWATVAVTKKDAADLLGRLLARQTLSEDGIIQQIILTYLAYTVYLDQKRSAELQDAGTSPPGCGGTILNGDATITFISHASDKASMAKLLAISIARLQSRNDGPQGTAKQALLTQRLELIKHIALYNSPEKTQVRKFFVGSNIFLPFIAITKDCWEQDKYSIELLRVVMSAMRAAYDSDHLKAIRDEHFANLLMDVCAVDTAGQLDRRLRTATTPQWDIVVDALFIIGTCCIDHETREVFTKADAVERLLFLLKSTFHAVSLASARKRTLLLGRRPSLTGRFSRLPSKLKRNHMSRRRDTEEVPEDMTERELGQVETVTDLGQIANEIRDLKRLRMNGCLALATLTIGHNANIATFGNNGGVQLTVDLMECAVEGTSDGALDDFDYDVGNGAAAVICNSSYKRPDVQEAFGNRNACIALMQFMKKYDGSSSVSAMRSLSSILKAVANLALFPANVEQFVAEGIGESFEFLLLRHESMTSAVLAVTLRTLSNLVMEFSTENMEVFSSTLPPLIGVLQKPTEPVIAALAFDVLGALCRVLENAEMFHQLKGPQTVLAVLKTQAFEEFMNYFGLKLLTRLCICLPDQTVEILVDDGIFEFSCSLLESSHVPSYVACSGLRLMLRMVQQSAGGASAFVATGGLHVLLNHMTQCTNHTASEAPPPSTDEKSSAPMSFSNLDDSLRPRRKSLTDNETTQGDPTGSTANAATLSTLACWLLAAVLVKHAGTEDLDCFEQMLHKPLLSPRTRKTTLAAKGKQKSFAAVTKSAILEEGLAGATTASSPAGTDRPSDVGDDESVNSDEGCQTLSPETFGDDPMSPLSSRGDRDDQSPALDNSGTVWSELGLSTEALIALAAKLCESLREELHLHSSSSGKQRVSRRKTLFGLLGGAASAAGPLVHMNTDFIMAATAIVAFASTDNLISGPELIRCGFPAVELLQKLVTQAFPLNEEVDLTRLVCYIVCHIGAKCEAGQLRSLWPGSSDLVPLLDEGARLMNDTARGGILMSLMRTKENIRGSLMATDLCLLLRGLLAAPVNEQEFREALPMIANIFPLLLAGSNKSSFPNGVQDISQRLKQWLRNGGEARGIFQGKELPIPSGASLTSLKIEKISWRASSDLLSSINSLRRFEWRLGRKGLYNQKRNVGTIQCAQLGHCSAPLRAMARTSPALLRPSCCCVLLVKASESSSSSATEEISLVFRTGAATRRFYQAVLEWREAASSGMD